MNTKKIALVTGASSGIGKATSVALARAGFRVVMLCRCEGRGRAALEEARLAASAGGGEGELELALCDLASAASVRRFAAGFAARPAGEACALDVLVLNAGVVSARRRETEDGFELQLGVNHLGHFLLASLLQGAVKAARGRIVVVASGAHRVGRIHWEDLQLRRGYTAAGAYAQSKLANVLFARELARRLAGTGVAVGCLHPGAVATSLGVNRDTGFGKLLTGLLKPFFLSPEEGADTAVYLALSPEAAGAAGEYYYRRKPVRPSARARDDDAAARLWELSERLVASAGL
jgi:NAD(P)-dependent dehydrogenase (short-subunit alcohol dehydrogenase family)